MVNEWEEAMKEYHESYVGASFMCTLCGDIEDMEHACYIMGDPFCIGCFDAIYDVDPGDFSEDNRYDWDTEQPKNYGNAERREDKMIDRSKYDCPCEYEDEITCAQCNEGPNWRATPEEYMLIADACESGVPDPEPEF